MVNGRADEPRRQILLSSRAEELLEDHVAQIVQGRQLGGCQVARSSVHDTESPA